MAATIYIGISGWHYRHWAKKYRAEAAKGRDMFLYFDNDQAGHAALNAQRLKEILRLAHQ
ncbi:MAG: hypothetical protein RLZZ227_114 [Pseudomonadota bacterium]|jgi:uncharacterized protein YecE (DUF72 family)